MGIYYKLHHAPWCVSIYKKYRLFGGPEEGGWYYSYYTFSSCDTFKCEKTAKEFAKALSKNLGDGWPGCEASQRRLRAASYAALPATHTPNTHEGDYIPRGWHDGTSKPFVHVARTPRAHEGASDEDGNYAKGFVPYYC
tara:strand:+ start:68 stop:484 length:417 start_codon:yes stop_codon:yes gene_type:complete